MVLVGGLSRGWMSGGELWTNNLGGKDGQGGGWYYGERLSRGVVVSYFGRREGKQGGPGKGDVQVKQVGGNRGGRWGGPDLGLGRPPLDGSECFFLIKVL